MRDAYICGLAIDAPRPVSTDQFLAIDREMRARHGQPPDVADSVERFLRATGIQTRHTVSGAWAPGAASMPSDIDDIFTPVDFDPPFWQRMAAWKQAVPPMSARAAAAAIANWGGDPQEITHIITTCTSGWSEPGMACHIIDALGLRDDCAKAELNFNGCFCGATCLRLARDIVRGGESGYVLVVAAEATSLHYSPTDTAASTLVANALFADGAAAAVVGPDGPWRLDRAGMRLVPNTRDLLRLTPPADAQQQSYRMFLHREVGARLGAWFEASEGATLLDLFLEKADGLPALAVHPGGPNILDGVERALLKRGWASGVLQTSYGTLHEYGNLGCAAILFVLARTLPTVRADRLCTLAFGPGVTVEWGLLSRASS